MDDSVQSTIIDELNKTGLFLETLVFTALNRRPEFSVKREEPYSGFTSEGFEGTIDVLAVTKVHNGPLLCFSIECKKADPQQKHWVFELRSSDEDLPFPFEYYEVGKADANYHKNIFFPSLNYHGMKYLDKAIQSFEFNETTGKLSRNRQLGRPYDALKQANEAVSSFLDGRERKRIFDMAYVKENQTDILFLPLVVTTANLHVLEYNPRNIDWLNGEVPTDKLKMVDRNWVHFEFPLPYSLRSRTNQRVGPVKRSSLIVNSESFADFITKLVKDCKSYVLNFN